MSDETVVVREDVEAILKALFDFRVLLTRIAEAVGGDDDEEDDG